MDSSSQPQQKNQRRKRKDPESRDFVCKCGKSYLSYAAAYTHVKNKHQGDKEFLQNISKPERERLKRGRPKERRQISKNSQTQLLSIIQETILQIFQACRKDETNGAHKIVLEGNQQLRGDELSREYESLVKKKGEPGPIDLMKNREKYNETGKIIINFIENLNKHFLPSIAAKTHWTINCLLANCCAEVPLQEEKQNETTYDLEINFEKVQNLKEYPHLLNVWEGKQEIISFITQSFEKWVSSYDKANNHRG